MLRAGVDKAFHRHDTDVVLGLSALHRTLQALLEVRELLGGGTEEAAVGWVGGVAGVDVGAGASSEEAGTLVVAFLLDVPRLLLWEERAAAGVCLGEQLRPAEVGECVGTVPVVKERRMVLLRSGHARPGPDMALEISDGGLRVLAKHGG